MTDTENSSELLITLTTDIVAAHVGANNVPVSDVPGLIRNVHDALSGLGKEKTEEVKPVPAVSIRSSVKPDYIVCLEDGVKLKMLKRHLMTHHQMTTEEYRAKWGLPASYPMVAPNYAEKRRQLAKASGLGRKPAAAPAAPAKTAEEAPAAAPAPARRVRTRKKPATAAKPA